MDVHVALVRGDGRVLLSRRRDRDSRFDGKWHLPAGKVEGGESLLDAAVREIAEEVGVVVRGEDLRFFHLTHAVAPGVEARVGVFFAVREWGGEPAVLEPEKCSAVRWFAIGDLPRELLEYAAVGLRALGESEAAGRRGGVDAGVFSVHGWE
ncbi:NUDIX domain-containing protein [Actinosynnema sp. NPDC059797]